ncbi:MAG: hypothetical protein ABEN55_08645, partial [Bradymonadaceae bacterium]
SGDPVNYVRLQDITSGETGSCNSSISSGDPGADVFGVELRDSDGNTIGWGKTATSNLADKSNNDFKNTGVLSGSKPDLSGGENGMCPKFSNSTILALGCGGSVTVSFQDSEGNQVELKNGQTIVVYEYGQQCGSSGDSQYVKISGCPAGTEQKDFINGSVSCSNGFGSGRGQFNQKVSLSK